MAFLRIKQLGDINWFSTICTGRRPLPAHNSEDFNIRKGTSYKYAYSFAWHEVDDSWNMKPTDIVAYHEGRFTFPGKPDPEPKKEEPKEDDD